LALEISIESSETEMISEERIDNAVNWMAVNADRMGEARGRMVYLDGRKKAIIASLRRLSKAKTQAERDDHAYTHPDYEEWIKDYEIAVKEYELLRANHSARESLISVWQTQQKSMLRGIK